MQDQRDGTPTGEKHETGYRVGTDLQLRGDVQTQIFRSKMLMSRARELVEALRALTKQRRN